MHFNVICESLKEYIWKPGDYTDRFWYENTWGITWSEQGEDAEDPDEWEDSYSSERVRQRVEQGEYILMDLDGCDGSTYQVIFSKNKEVQH